MSEDDGQSWEGVAECTARAVRTVESACATGRVDRVDITRAARLDVVCVVVTAIGAILFSLYATSPAAGLELPQATELVEQGTRKGSGVQARAAQARAVVAWKDVLTMGGEGHDGVARDKDGRW